MAADNREARLVLLAQTGDREALDELFRAVQQPIFRYLTRIAGNPHEAEDLLQETLLRIHKKLKWLAEPRAFRPWCYRIASRLALRRLRRRGPRFEERAIDELPEPPQEPIRLEALPQQVAALSPASRAVIVLHYLESLRLEEVAAVLGIPLGTVKSRLHYGLHQLREKYGGTT